MAGYRAAMAAAGLETVAFHGRPSRAFGRDRALGLLSDHPGIEGAICFSDLVALGMLAGFAQAGVRVGTDFRLVGFDDIEECALSSAVLTRAATSRFGRKSAETMLAWLGGRRAPAGGSGSRRSRAVVRGSKRRGRTVTVDVPQDILDALTDVADAAAAAGTGGGRGDRCRRAGGSR